MDVGTLRIALELIGSDLSGGAFSSFTSSILNLSGAAQNLIGALAGAGAAFLIFKTGVGYAIEAGAALQQAGVMASIAISDGAQHVGQLEDAIINLANTSQYKIADVDMAFRVLGGLGFDTGQILGGMGQEAIILAQALGGPGAGISAADAAHVLGQALLLFQSQGLTAKQAADALTGAFYNNMMSVQDLQQYLGMAGGTASSLGVSFQSLMTFGSMLTPMFGSASSAGASLSYMMRNLAHPATQKMADMIKHLNLQIYDSHGRFVGLKSIMDQLFADTAGMTQQQKMDVFGTLFNVRSGRAAMDLMNETKSQFDSTYSRIYGRITQVGQAQRDSDAINNSTIGTWNRLITTINDFFAKAGDLIGGALRPLMNALNNLFSTLQKSPQVEKFLAIFLVVGTVLSGVALIVLAVWAAIMVLGAGLAIAAGVFAGIFVVAALVAGAFLLFTTNAKAASTATGIFHGVLSVLGGIFSVITAPYEAFINGLRTGFNWIGQFVGPLIKSVITDLQTFGKDIGGIASTGVTFMVQALQHLGGTFSGLLPILQDFLQLLGIFGQVFGLIAAWIVALLMPVLEALGMAFLALWNGIVAVLSGAVTAISGLLQIFIGLFKVIFGTLISLLTGHTDQAKQILIDGWNNIKSGVVDLVKGLAMMVIGIFTGLLGSLLSLVGGLVAGVVRFFQNLFDHLVGHSIVPDMINAIIRVAETLAPRFLGAIASLPGKVINVIGSLELQVLGKLNDLAGQMLQSGLHLMQNLAQGIMNGLGAVGNAIGNAASKVASFLHFSVPEEGPLSTMMTWMPDMMKNLAAGITDNIPLIEHAAGKVATTLTGTINTPSTTSAQTGGVMSAAQSGSVQTFTVPVQIDGKTVAQAMFQVVGGQLRQNGMSRMGRG